MTGIVQSFPGWTVLLAADEVAKPSRTLLDYIESGGIIGYTLIGLSVFAVSLAIINFIQLRRSKMAPVDVVVEISRLLREGNTAAVAQLCAAPEADCFLTRVLRSAIARCNRSPFGFLEVRTALEEGGQRELDSLSRPTDGLGLIANLGPMLGLLGTVIGMIGAFGAIGEAEGAARSQQLAMFMSLALVNTALGLIVAIPCTFAYALFKKRTERMGAQVSDIIEDWIPLFGPPPAAEAVPTGAPARPRPAQAPARPFAPEAPVRGARPA